MVPLWQDFSVLIATRLSYDQATTEERASLTQK